MIQKLNDKILREATHWLAERDIALNLVFQQYGYPPLWAREPGFSTLVHIILEQQVSLASANAAFQRLQEHLGTVTPEVFIQLEDDTLRQIGFSRQKMLYTRTLATTLLDGRLDLESLEDQTDDEVRATLLQLKGIGNWTVDIYLSECLLRPDILPQGDIAMQEAFRVLKDLPERPKHETFTELTRHWRPWRSVGTRMLWHFYLCERRRPNS
ncbi:MAG: DNA-3-methyladenine glycosylase 2 family protein [Bacteroidetes bacterium]|nr:MAG: DNA-3-methyladenine glycosylase 2 family protein [Bacteroidota bacterium]